MGSCRGLLVECKSSPDIQQALQHMAAAVRSLRLKVSSNHELVSACLDRGGARDFAGYIRHFV